MRLRHAPLLEAPKPIALAAGEAYGIGPGGPYLTELDQWLASRAEAIEAGKALGRRPLRHVQALRPALGLGRG